MNARGNSKKNPKILIVSTGEGEQKEQIQDVEDQDVS